MSARKEVVAFYVARTREARRGANGGSPISAAAPPPTGGDRGRDEH